MNRKRIRAASVLFVAAALLLFASIGTAQSEKPQIAPICKQCHKPDESVLRGLFSGISKEASTVQVQIGTATWLVRFDGNTKLVGAEKFSEITKEKEIAIALAKRNGELYAVSLSVKPPAKVPEEKLIKVEDVARLVELGTEKGKYSLVDSRPAARFNEGHIPGAISIYDAEFEKNLEKLPKEKEQLLIFYCGGVT